MLESTFIPFFRQAAIRFEILNTTEVRIKYALKLCGNQMHSVVSNIQRFLKTYLKTI